MTRRAAATSAQARRPRLLIGGAATLACLGTLLAPVGAHADPLAELPPGAGDAAPASPAVDERPAAEAVATATAVAFPVVSTSTVYTLGTAAPVSATVRPVAGAGGSDGTGSPEGSVEFFDGTQSLGAAAVDASGRAAIETAAWGGSGARSITAVFTPADPAAWAPSTSAAQIYRIVDTARIVPDVVVDGDPVAELGDASLEWTIANIWFSNFSVGFEREAVSGSVSLEDIPVGTTIAEKQRHFFRPFTFSGGTGVADADGDRVIDFTGVARLTSGSGNRWDFADPRLHLGANGDGYLTAEFSGFYNIGVEQSYGPVRVTIATFSGAQLTTDQAGRATAEIELHWEGQARGTGTWANGFDSSFPNEFVALLNPGINLFFAGSGVATDGSKKPHPIRLSFTEQRVDTGTGEPGTGEPGRGEPGSGGPAGPGDPGTQQGGTGSETPARGGRGGAGAVLSSTGGAQLVPGAAAAMFLVGTGAMILIRRRPGRR